MGATSRAPTTPATAPDRVFPGLTTGESLGPPKVRPPNIAAVSHTQVTTSGKQTSHSPAQLRGGSAPCRIRTIDRGKRASVAPRRAW